MPPRPEQQQLAQVQATLLVTDATKELIAAPGVGLRIVVFTIHGSIIVSAAFTCDIESGNGIVELIKMGLSPPLGFFRNEWRGGFPMPFNTSLRIQPSAAGPSVHASVEYYIEGKF